MSYESIYVSKILLTRLFLISCTILSVLCTLPEQTLVTISATSGRNGSIVPYGPTSIKVGENLTYSIIPDPKHRIANVYVDDKSIGAVDSYIFENVSSDHSIHATFERDVYTICPKIVKGEGTIYPDGYIEIQSGDSISFIITPDSNYILHNVIIDDSSVGAVTSVSFPHVTANHSLKVSFLRDVDTIPVTDSNIVYTGRFDFSDSENVSFAWPGISITASFEGTYCGMLLRQVPVPEMAINSKYNANYYNIFIDDREPKVIKATVKDSIFEIAKNLPPGPHTVTIYKRTEALCGTGEFLGFLLDRGTHLLPPPQPPERRIEFIGNSITCGYGNEGKSTDKFKGSIENSYLSYAAITARNLDAEYHLISYAGIGIHLNSDSSTTNTIPEIYNRCCPLDSSIAWNFISWTPHVVVINLGANDFGTIGGIPDSLAFINSYQNFIRRIHNNYPESAIFCLDGPMPGYPVIDTVSGEQITSLDILRNYLNKIVENAKSDGISNIYTFSLTLIDPDIGYGAEGHPNVYQHKLNAAELTVFIREKMGW